MERPLGKIAVLMGGKSSEREVSLMSGQGVLDALRSKGLDVEAVDPSVTSLWTLKDLGFQRAFIALHGQFGEDGHVQAILNSIKLPYTGSGVAACALSMDKWRTKLIWQTQGIPTPECVVLSDQDDFSSIEEKLKLPLVVKPSSYGSSVGVEKIYQPGHLQETYLRLMKCYHGQILAERMIQGPEYAVSILGDRVLPSIRIEAPDGLYDMHHKYYSEDTQYRCPSGLSNEEEKYLASLCLKAFKLLGAKTWGRIDLMRDTLSGEFFLLELNTSPGMTSHSLVPKSAKQIGISYADLCLWIITHAECEPLDE